jgi:hypothetical protein
MVTRRELIAAGVAGGLSTAAPSAAAPSQREEQGDREAQRDIASRLRGIESILNTAHASSTLSFGYVPKIRGFMEQFLRANSKFPDFFEIGTDVFIDLYDWHVKNRQPLTIARLGDGRYTMQFMFSTMILRPEQDPKYVGYPYDKA